MAWTARPAPARPSPYRRPCQPASPAQQRTPSTQHASASTTPSTPKDKDRGQRQTERRPATARPACLPARRPAARLLPVDSSRPPASRPAWNPPRHPIRTTRPARPTREGEGKRRRATDEEPRPRAKNFFTRPYIERTPPRYTPKDTPAACILHRLQRPFSACLASRADRLQFCFWRVCRTRRPKRPTTDATNARPPAPCPPADGGAFTFSARRHF